MNALCYILKQHTKGNMLETDAFALSPSAYLTRHLEQGGGGRGRGRRGRGKEGRGREKRSRGDKLPNSIMKDIPPTNSSILSSSLPPTQPPLPSSLLLSILDFSSDGSCIPVLVTPPCHHLSARIRD